MKSILTNIVCCLIALIAVIWLLQECGRDPEVITVTDTTYVHDTTQQRVEVGIPQPYAVYRTDTVYNLDPASCEHLAQAYNEIKYYRDTLINDTGAIIVLDDTITKNGFLNRTLYFRNRRPTQIIINNTTLIADRPKFQLFAGPVVTYVKGNSPGVGGGVLLSSKTFAAGYSFDITNRTNYLQMYFSIIKGSRGN